MHQRMTYAWFSFSGWPCLPGGLSLLLIEMKYWNTIELHWTAGCSSAFHCNSTSHNPTKTRRSLPTCQQSVWSDQRWCIQSAWKCLAGHFSNPRWSKRNIQGPNWAQRKESNWWSVGVAMFPWSVQKNPISNVSAQPCWPSVTQTHSRLEPPREVEKPRFSECMCWILGSRTSAQGILKCAEIKGSLNIFTLQEVSCHNSMGMRINISGNGNEALLSSHASTNCLYLTLYLPKQSNPCVFDIAAKELRQEDAPNPCSRAAKTAPCCLRDKDQMASWHSPYVCSHVRNNIFPQPCLCVPYLTFPQLKHQFGPWRSSWEYWGEDSHL